MSDGFPEKVVDAQPQSMSSVFDDDNPFRSIDDEDGVIILLPGSPIFDPSIRVGVKAEASLAGAPNAISAR